MQILEDVGHDVDRRLPVAVASPTPHLVLKLGDLDLPGQDLLLQGPGKVLVLGALRLGGGGSQNEKSVGQVD